MNHTSCAEGQLEPNIQLKGSLVIWSLQHGITGDYCLEFADGVCAFWSPHKGYILLDEVLDGSNYLCIFMDERVVVSKQF